MVSGKYLKNGPDEYMLHSHSASPPWRREYSAMPHTQAGEQCEDDGGAATP